MARQCRIYFQNATYHICIRGNNRQNILKEDEDKEMFLASLEKFRVRFGFRLYGFVIMDNHVHLVIETQNKVNISKVMHAVTLSYSVKFRRKYAYTGYVWQGRFKSNVIDDEQYIYESITYIHNNPVRAGIVNNVEDYPWSSYHFYHGSDSRLKDYIQIDRFGSLTQERDTSYRIS